MKTNYSVNMLHNNLQKHESLQRNLKNTAFQKYNTDVCISVNWECDDKAALIFLMSSYVQSFGSHCVVLTNKQTDATENIHFVSLWLGTIEARCIKLSHTHPVANDTHKLHDTHVTSKNV